MLGEFGRPNELCYQKIKHKHSSTKVIRPHKEKSHTTCFWTHHFNDSNIFQRKCITYGGYEKQICSQENEDLRIYMYFVRRTPTLLEHPQIWIYFSQIGPYNWIDIIFHSESIQEENSSPFGKIVEMLNFFTRSFRVKKNPSNTHLDLLLHKLHLNKSNFEWIELVGDIWSPVKSDILQEKFCLIVSGK